MKNYKLLIVFGFFAFQVSEACKFPIPNNVNQTCGAEVVEVLKTVSSCKKAEGVLKAFDNVTSLSSSLCSTIVNVLEAALVPSNSEKTAEIIDYIGIGAWMYLASRVVAKKCIPSIQRSDVLQSRFQKFLSSDWTAFFMTIPCSVGFLGLAGEWEGLPLIISACASGIPAVFGSLQFCFDWFWKVPKFFFKCCCGCCLPTSAELEEECRKLIVHNEGEIKKLEDENEILKNKMQRDDSSEDLTEGGIRNEKSDD